MVHVIFRQYIIYVVFIVISLCITLKRALCIKQGKRLKFNATRKELPTGNLLVLMDINNIMQKFDKLSKQVIAFHLVVLCHSFSTLG